ncbi:MAG TPA: EAL domain-containing protein, partial [Magnetovibrio sp.]
GFLSEGGREVFAAWRYLPNLNWALLVRVDVDEGMQPIYEARIKLIGLAVIGALVLIFFAFSVARTITRPLAELTDIAHEISSGKFDHTASIASDDEVGILAKALNKMSAQLQSMLRELDQNNIELEHRVAERTGDLARANQDLLLLAAVVQSTSEGVVITDKGGKIVDINPAYCEITGYSREELIGQNPNINQSGVHDRDFYKDMWTGLNECGHWSGEIWDKKKDGTVYPKLLTINELKNERGEVSNYVGIFTDISEIKAVEKELETLAYFDPLTDLPNRSLYRDRLKQSFSSAQRSGDKVALMLLDLDHFKYVNDTLGHQAGDELLKMVAERIEGRVREADTVARLGGDEFAVILPSINDLNTVGHIAQDVVDLLSKPFSLEGQDVYVGVSIGISIYPDDAGDGEALNKNADMAMYKAKESGRGRYNFYQSEMDEQARKRLVLERNLRRALVHDEFRVFYQPKVAIRENKIVGMEALVRWFDPDQGMISPADFVPIAEENGMIVFIDQFVLRAACSQLKHWRDAGWDLRVAVNLSALQFRQSDLVEIVEGVLKEYDLPPGALELEITESAIMDDPDAAIALTQGLRDLGVYLSIDDFGTGYSSLAYLKKFPINTLKIDQAFVRDLTWDSDDAAIVRSVITLSESLTLNVVAEGIETEEQRKFLLEHNCGTGQGYYYSKPLPAEEFEILLKSGLK